ncbi:MAG: murein biosynthesis integral membrane protein MurJ [bacterium]
MATEKETRARAAAMGKATVGGAAVVVMAGMIVSRLLGFLRYRTITEIFGRSFETDAFFAAFMLPDLLYYLASGGALTAAFIPVFTEYLVNRKEKDAWYVASSVFNFSVLVIAASIAAGMVFAPFLIGKMVTPGFREHPATMSLTVTMSRIIFPMVILTSCSALCNGILHSFNHFHAPAISWSLHNLGIILAAVFLSSRYGIFSLCFGVLIGAASMVLVQLPVIAGKGAVYHPKMNLRHPGVSRVLKLFVPAMLGLSVTQINLMYFPKLFGSYLGEGIVSSLEIADRILLVPLGLFGSALSMAIFPALSRKAADAGSAGEFRKTLARGIVATLFFSVPSTVFLVIMSLPVIRFLFESRTFGLEDCEATALALRYFAVGLAGHTALQVIARGFYALKDTTTPFITGFLSVICISVPGCAYLSGTALGHGGIALSISLSTIANMLMLFVILRSRVRELDAGAIVKSFMKIALASALMGVTCLYMKAVLSWSHPAIQVMVNMSVSGSLFILFCFILKVEVTAELFSAFARKFSGRERHGKGS